MARTCFVIMPFSSTSSCTEAEWTQIFETLFKPAVEGAGLDYECRRSEAMRGNIVAGIIHDLDDAYVVLADLTDRNPNVFYELGVRHALRIRTIIVAQRRTDIPFDLLGYASHVYDWKSGERRNEFAERIQALLREVDSNPDRPDNPVSDFLQVKSHPQEPLTFPPKNSTDSKTIRSLIGPNANGLDVITLTRDLARSGQNRAAKDIRRQTRPDLLKYFRSVVEELNKRDIPQRIGDADIPNIAKDFIALAEPLSVKIEEFALTCADENWKEGTLGCMGLAGDMIGLSESPQEGRNLRFATGLPALLALRLLLLMGSKALEADAFELLKIILWHPIEIERSGRFSHRSFSDQKNLFHPEAFLGYADHTTKYIADLWENQPHLRPFFDSNDDFHFHLAQFLMILSLCDAGKEGGEYLLFPAYKLVPNSGRAMSALRGRIASVPTYREKIADIALNQSGNDLQQKWPTLAAKLNAQNLGPKYWHSSGPSFPLSLEKKSEDDW